MFHLPDATEFTLLLRYLYIADTCQLGYKLIPASRLLATTTKLFGELEVPYRKQC